MAKQAGKGVAEFRPYVTRSIPVGANIVCADNTGAKILEVIKLEKGCQGLVTRGINAGQIGKIEDIEEGTFILPKRIVLALSDRKIEIPADIIMAIGKEEPIIQLK